MRRRQRYFGGTEKDALLAALGDCRQALCAAETRLKPFCEEYKGCLRISGAIDDLEGMRTGDKTYFHLKIAPAPSVPKKGTEGGDS